MRILIADDDAVSRLRLKATLAKRKHDIVEAVDGAEAWQALQEDDHPRLAILDWMMPGLDGIEICRRIRARPDRKLLYLILLTTRDSTDNVVAGLGAGANDYVIKPFDAHELHARVEVGVQVAQLQADLAEQIKQLQEALTHVKTLRGLLPICCYCKKIRDDQNYWHQVESYISNHVDVAFSHGICPACLSQAQADFLKAKSEELRQA